MAQRMDNWDDMASTPDSFLLPEEKTVIWVHLPNGGMGRLDLTTGELGWRLIENDDGTISLQPSIDMRGEDSWHGYLTNNEFVEVG